VSVDLTGAADLHCHFGPDAHRARSVTAFEAASEAAAAGHAAVVLKAHDTPTAGLAWAVDAVTPGVRVFGGICCDIEVGGLNPSAVETALRLGAKVVWLPTLSSRQDWENGIGARLGYSPPGLSCFSSPDSSGSSERLSADTQEVLRLVAEHDVILATGHVSAAEHLAVAREFGRRGRVVVTHATEDMAGPNLSVSQCRDLADLGCTIELCAMTCIGALATRSVEEMAACIREVGPARVTLGTDYGQAVNPHPAAGLQTYADALWAAGIPDTDIRRMACDNPLALLGL
jgi:hypothetical protein